MGINGEKKDNIEIEIKGNLGIEIEIKENLTKRWNKNTKIFPQNVNGRSSINGISFEVLGSDDILS